tara:strand:+ start:630 stop:782 length:153 start_codon:yes stop_codon:yes gene_type:complete
MSILFIDYCQSKAPIYISYTKPKIKITRKIIIAMNALTSKKPNDIPHGNK